MRKSCALTLLLCLLAATLSHAKIWIVDNNPISVGDFTNLSSAQSSGISGDTIYVYPSNTAYSAITLTKKLFLFGVGFNLDIYGGQALPASSLINGTMVFNSGSEGSLLTGFGGDFRVDINTANITIKRNKILLITIDGSNCIISQNEMIGNVSPANVFVGTNFANILIANNKIHNTGGIYSGNDCIESHDNSTLTIVNNVLKTVYEHAFRNLSSTTIVQNNIIISGNCSAAALYQHNMSNSNQLPQTNGNIININMTTVFEDPNNFITGLHLLPGSPARGSGFNGTDMGVYGGNDPFIDGGLPGLPSIFYFESEATTSLQQGLDVIIKAKSNNE